MASETVIGIDLDNTLICYDDIFHLAACEEGLIDASLPRSKEKVRDAIRLLPHGESRWTRLQAIVYGPRMAGATMFEGIEAFFSHCRARHLRTFVVSHKTRFTSLDGQPVDLRRAALDWMKAQGFFNPDRFALSQRDVFFEDTRLEKIERIRSLCCTHFIDDLTEVFAEKTFPENIVRLLFAPHGTDAGLPGVPVFKSWRELDRFIFNEPGH